MEIDEEIVKKAEFKKAVQEIFTDDGDHTFFDNLLNKKSTIVISIKIFNIVSNAQLIIVFASITKINQNRDISLVILHYIGSTEFAPNDIIPSFNCERFCGKELGKLLLTLIQSISNILCTDKDNIVMPKCNNELQLFYESMGFKCVTKKSKWFNISEVTAHYQEIQATKSLHCNIIESDIVIEHKSKIFINHVEQTLDNIDFSLSMKDLIVSKCHKIFSARDVYNKMIDSTHMLVNNSEFMFIQIGKVIQHIFQDIKPTDFDHFLKLYL